MNVVFPSPHSSPSITLTSRSGCLSLSLSPLTAAFSLPLSLPISLSLDLLQCTRFLRSSFPCILYNGEIPLRLCSWLDRHHGASTPTSKNSKRGISASFGIITFQLSSPFILISSLFNNICQPLHYTNISQSPDFFYYFRKGHIQVRSFLLHSSVDLKLSV